MKRFQKMNDKGNRLLYIIESDFQILPLMHVQTSIKILNLYLLSRWCNKLGKFIIRCISWPVLEKSSCAMSNYSLKQSGLECILFTPHIECLSNMLLETVIIRASKRE